MRAAPDLRARRTWLWAPLLLTAFLGGCAGEIGDGAGAGPGDGKTGMDGGVDIAVSPDLAEEQVYSDNWLSPDNTSDWEHHCNTSTLRGNLVMEMAVDRDMPHGEGGVFQSGVYVMTEKTIWTGLGGMAGPTGSSESQTAFCLVKGDVVHVGVARDNLQKNLIAIPTPGTSELNVQQVCPTDCGACSLKQEYTATPSSLILYGDGPVPNRSRTFIRIE